jgi:hypothetical protein
MQSGVVTINKVIGGEGLSFLLQYNIRGFKLIKFYIKINVKGFRSAGIDWVDLAQNADR